VTAESIPNIKNKKNNTKLSNFTQRLGTALNTTSQKSELSLSTSSFESQYILIEHV
jgi:hypothetical protein